MNDVPTVSETARQQAIRQAQWGKASKDHWWVTQAPQLLDEAFAETIDMVTAQRLVDAARQSDWFEVGAIFWAAVEPYLEQQCEQAHDPEA